MRPVRELTQLLPVYEDNGFNGKKFIVCHDDDEGKPEYIRARPVGLPVVIEITDEVFSNLRQKISDRGLTGADAYCLGFPNKPWSKGEISCSGVQYYKIQKPFRKKVEGVLKTFWDRIEQPYAEGGLR